MHSYVITTPMSLWKSYAVYWMYPGVDTMRGLFVG